LKKYKNRVIIYLNKVRAFDKTPIRADIEGDE